MAFWAQSVYDCTFRPRRPPLKSSQSKEPQKHFVHLHRSTPQFNVGTVRHITAILCLGSRTVGVWQQMTCRTKLWGFGGDEEELHTGLLEIGDCQKPVYFVVEYFFPIHTVPRTGLYLVVLQACNKYIALAVHPLLTLFIKAQTYTVV